jgi:hypothetical protein
MPSDDEWHSEKLQAERDRFDIRQEEERRRYSMSEPGSTTGSGGVVVGMLVLGGVVLASLWLLTASVGTPFLPWALLIILFLSLTYGRGAISTIRESASSVEQSNSTSSAINSDKDTQEEEFNASDWRSTGSARARESIARTIIDRVGMGEDEAMSSASEIILRIFTEHGIGLSDATGKKYPNVTDKVITLAESIIKPAAPNRIHCYRCNLVLSAHELDSRAVFCEGCQKEFIDAGAISKYKVEVVHTTWYGFMQKRLTSELKLEFRPENRLSYFDDTAGNRDEGLWLFRGNSSNQASKISNWAEREMHQHMRTHHQVGSDGILVRGHIHQCKMYINGSQMLLLGVDGEERPLQALLTRKEVPKKRRAS